MCMETFTSPRLLPCFHTFCLGCLQQLVRKQQSVGSFPCPTCRATTNIPPGGVDKFQVNFYIEAEVESSGNVVRTCDMCHKGPATHKCSDCDQFACDTCTAIHASIAATKSHTVLNLKNTQTAGTKGAVLVKKERYCSTHREEKIRFFCTQCSTVICRDCKLTSHERHATTDLFEKSSEAKRLVLQVTRRSRDNLVPKLRQALQEAQNQKKKVQASKKTILGTLEQRAADLKQEIDKSLAEAKRKLNQETDDVDKIASRCIDNMTQELACFLSLVDHAQRVAESGCDADILEMPTQMKQFFGVADDSAPVTEQRHRYGGYGGFDNGVKPPDSMPAFGLGQMSMGTFPSGASNSLGAAIQMPPLVQQTLYLPVNQPTSVPDCQLKSFTSEEWKVDVQLKNEDTLKTCECCSKKYNRNAEFCQHCHTNNPTRHAPNSYRGGFGYQSFGASNVKVHCKNCGGWYLKNTGSCSACGAAESESESCEDVLATIQKAIPQFIGHVTRSRQSQADEFEGETYEDFYKDEDDCGDSSGDEFEAFVRNFRRRSSLAPPTAPRLQPPPPLPLVSVGASRPKSSGNSTTSQIATEINAIRSLLSGWHSLATEEKELQFDW